MEVAEVAFAFGRGVEIAERDVEADGHFALLRRVELVSRECDARVKTDRPLDEVSSTVRFLLGDGLLRASGDPMLVCFPGLGVGARLALQKAARADAAEARL